MVSVYWGLLHKTAVKKECGDPTWGKYRCIELFEAHIIPGLFCLLNMIWTICVMNKKFSKITIYFGILYFTNNFVYVKVTGETMYWMFNHSDGWKTWAWIFGTTTVFYTVYLLLCILDKNLNKYMQKISLELFEFVDKNRMP